MKKSYIGLSLVLPCYLLAQNVALDDVQVVEQVNEAKNTMNIDLQKVEQQQANSLFDLFKDNASINVGGGAVNVQRIYLRGIESSNLNITLDGARQGKNMFQHRGNELGANTDILKQVQINTYSDASDGSGALGGSIKMETKDAHDFATGDKTFGGIIKTGYETNSDTKHGSLIAYNVINPHFGIYASISGVNSDNYEDGNHEDQIATAYTDRDYLVKMSLLDVANNDLRITLSQNENSGDSQWAGTDAKPHPTDLEKISSTTTNYTLQHNYNPSDLIDLDTDVNFTTIVLDREEKDIDYKNETFGLKIQNHFNFNLLNTKNRLSLGGQYENQHGVGEFSPTKRVDKDKNGIKIDYAGETKYADVDSNSKSLFVQNRMNLDDLNIYYGVRFDDYEFETGLGKATDTTLSPNLGFDYALTESSLFYANYSQNSRMTGIIPFTWLNNIRKNTSYSSDLEAEKATKYEIGYKYNTDGVLTQNDSLGFNLSVFKSTIENLILARDMNGGSGEGGRTLEDIYNNSDDFDTKGFELGVTYNLERYTTALSYSHINADEIEDNGTSTTGVDESIAIRRIGAFDTRQFVFSNYYDIDDSLNFGYTLNAIKGIDDPIERSGYVTHDISMTYNPANYSAWTLYVGVDNLTNKTYGSHTTIAASNDPDYYRYETGRNYKFSIKYVF